MEYKHSRNQVFLINYHLVWCPKRRKKVLVNKIAKRLKEIFNQVAKDKDIDILTLEVMPEHLHLFVSCQPQMTIHKLVKAFKARSSNILRKEFPQLLKLPSLWTNSYFVSTADNISHKTIQKYIENQSKK